MLAFRPVGAAINQRQERSSRSAPYRFWREADCGKADPRYRFGHGERTSGVVQRARAEFPILVSRDVSVGARYAGGWQAGQRRAIWVGGSG
jgi:hypothetical protein